MTRRVVVLFVGFVLCGALAAASSAAPKASCTPQICMVTLNSPANGATFPFTSGMTIQFTWGIDFICGDSDQSQCAHDFPVEVKIATDQTLQGVVQDKYAGFCTPNCPQSWTSLPFTQPGTYYWQVTTRGGSNVRSSQCGLVVHAYRNHHGSTRERFADVQRHGRRSEDRFRYHKRHREQRHSAECRHLRADAVASKPPVDRADRRLHQLRSEPEHGGRRRRSRNLHVRKRNKQFRALSVLV